MKRKNQNDKVEDVMRWEDTQPHSSVDRILFHVALSVQLVRCLRTRQCVRAVNAFKNAHEPDERDLEQKPTTLYCACDAPKKTWSTPIDYFCSIAMYCILICTIFHVNGVETKRLQQTQNTQYAHTHSHRIQMKERKEKKHNMKWQWRHEQKRRSSNKTLSQNELFMGIKITERACSDMPLVC